MDWGIVDRMSSQEWEEFLNYCGTRRSPKFKVFDNELEIYYLRRNRSVRIAWLSYENGAIIIKTDKEGFVSSGYGDEHKKESVKAVYESEKKMFKQEKREQRIKEEERKSLQNEKRLTSKETMENVSKDKIDFFHRLGQSYVAIRQLVDFMKVLEKNETDFEDEINIRIVKDTEIHPSDMLSLYIILEAYAFWEDLSYFKKENSSLPDLPPYFEKLKKVRHKLVAHKDNQEEFSLTGDAIEVIKELNDEARTEKIVEDIYETYKLVKFILEQKS